MFKLIQKLYQVNLLSPKGLYYFINALICEGTNLMALLRFAAKLYPKQVALNDAEGAITYNKLYSDCKKLALILQNNFNLHNHHKVALLCRNHLVAIQSMVSSHLTLTTDYSHQD